ncbi:Fur family transcriptional regulator [Thermotoga sp. SG1]|uniref:Fur family transcriptional regulator n=1 Tax=Thermotoga sp. SG1 TaxID=126739 RepID=UPI000C7659A9|nr:Fur family transcriptional regulator [Thermotoga sp. SG1]PLV57599.1 Fur family transcriptional regulator [Thermotoga sp. SG1]
MRMTENRKKILKIVEESKIPLTAEEIYKKAGVNLSTVYRALKFLEERKLVGSFSVSRGVRYFFRRDNHYHFMVCERCGKLFPFKECARELIDALQKKYRFSEESHLFLIYGVCENCRR